MHIQRGLDDFLWKWRKALLDQDVYWEGPRACTELKRKDYLERVRLEEGKGKESGLRHFIASHAIESICAELIVYRKNLKNVRNAISTETNLKEWLDQRLKAFRKKEQLLKSTRPDLASRISVLGDAIEGGIRLIDYQRQRKWEFPLAANGLAFAESGVGGINVPVQERELDSRFQIRLANRILRFSYKSHENQQPLTPANQGGSIVPH